MFGLSILSLLCPGFIVNAAAYSLILSRIAIDVIIFPYSQWQQRLIIGRFGVDQTPRAWPPGHHKASVFFLFVPLNCVVLIKELGA